MCKLLWETQRVFLQGGKWQGTPGLNKVRSFTSRTFKYFNKMLFMRLFKSKKSTQKFQNFITTEDVFSTLCSIGEIYHKTR